MLFCFFWFSAKTDISQALGAEDGEGEVSLSAENQKNQKPNEHLSFLQCETTKTKKNTGFEQLFMKTISFIM